VTVAKLSKELAGFTLFVKKTRSISKDKDSLLNNQAPTAVGTR
jgi:hypothetical protein